MIFDGWADKATYRYYAPINVKPQGGVGGGGGYLREVDSENLSLGRDFDTYSMCFPRVGEFDMPAIMEHRENLEMNYPQS